MVDLTIGEYRLSATDAILEIGPFAIAKTAVSGDFNTASVTLLQADANVEGDPSLLEPDSASAFFWVEDGDYVLVESTR
ncbi:MAG: hypothetical protein EP330_20655 [Deltaproteobacteria bacterium]|nr:MAG: hypothetical protein EP330_20655 [Deltaproteobacteria bacterium]